MSERISLVCRLCGYWGGKVGLSGRKMRDRLRVVDGYIGIGGGL